MALPGGGHPGQWSPVRARHNTPLITTR
jgi:hypothetical protein